MKLSLILEVVSKGADRIGRMTRETRALADRGMAPLERATNAATRAAERNDRQLSRVSASTFKWMRGTIRAADALDRAAARAARFAGRTGLKAIELGAVGAAKGLGLVVRKAIDLTKAAVAWGALGVGALGGWLVGGTIKTAADFEQLQIALEGTEGSATKAKAAMGWVSKFARDTPYELQEVADAFVRARGVGIDPMTGAMTKLGDAAGGARKTLMDAVEALADAQTGEFERLKEFNITTSVKGDRVSFSYIDKAGKNAEKSVGKSMASIRDAVLQIFDEKYGGGMLRQSRSMAGIWSNILGTITEIQLKVANAGFFDVVKGKLQLVLDNLNKLEADGTLSRWAQQVSDWLTLAIEKGEEFVRSVDWAQVADDGMRIARAMWAVALAMAKVVELAGKVRSGITWLQENRGSDLLGLTTPIPKPKVNPAPRVSADSWSRALRSGPPALAPAAPSMAGKGARPVDGKVKVEVELKGDAARGARTRVTSSSQQVPVSVWTGALRGPANGGPA